MVATRHSYHKSQFTLQHSNVRKNVIKRIHVIVATRHSNYSTTQNVRYVVINKPNVIVITYHRLL